MKLSELLTRSCVKVPLRAADKRAAIAELVDLLHETGRIYDRNGLLEAVLAREEARSTGIGYELAVPHGKSPACERLVLAVGKPAAPMEFEAIDGRPVNVIVLLASPPDQSGPHIQALARISRLMLQESFRKAVLDAATADELYRILTEGDA